MVVGRSAFTVWTLQPAAWSSFGALADAPLPPPAKTKYAAMIAIAIRARDAGDHEQAAVVGAVAADATDGTFTFGFFFGPCLRRALRARVESTSARW